MGAIFLIEHIKAASQEMIQALDAEFEARKNRIRATKSEWTLGENGTIYYVSENGDDNNDGKSPENAFRTLALINADGLLNEGDVVLFERGGRWHESLISKRYVTYSAYGEGDKPKICGSVDASNPKDWVLWNDKRCIYKYAHPLDKCTSLDENGHGRPNFDIGNIIFDDGKAYALRVYEDPVKPGYARLVGRGNMVSNGKEVWYKPQTKFTGPQDLSHDLEYYYDILNGELYLVSVYGNPGEVYERIDLAKKGNVVQIANGATLDNLAILYGAQHGVGGGNCIDLTVRNCEVGWIGGAVQHISPTHITRYGNSIEIFGTAKNYTIVNNYIYQAFDCGPTVQWQGDLTTQKEDQKRKHNLHIRVCGNAIERCNSPMEVWITTQTEQNEETYAILEDIVMSDNFCRYAGYGFGGYVHYKTMFNMFYGGGHTEATYKDAFVENNFMWHARVLIALAVPVNTRNGLGYNWRKNTIIKPYASEFSRMGADLERSLDPSVTYPYTNEIIDKMYETGAFGENNFYHYMFSEDERFNCI